MPSQIRTKKTSTRTIALWISLAMIIIYTLSVIYPEIAGTYSLHREATLASLLTYPLLHANIFHLLANIWTFLLIIFICPSITFRHILLSHFLSIVSGIFIITGLIQTECHIIGYSAPIYSLLAIRTLQVLSVSERHALSLFLTIVTSILITGIIPHVSLVIHILTFTLTLILLFPFAPIYRQSITSK